MPYYRLQGFGTLTTPYHLKKVLQRINNHLDRLNEQIGRGVSWVNTALVLLVCYDVAARYLFNVSSAGMVEMEWHLFSLVFLLGAGYTLLYDRHVRVDVFYQNFSKQKQAWVNLLGALCLLIPFCVVVIITSWQFMVNAFVIQEGSPDPGGLPARFMIKAAIPAGFVLLLLQALSLALHAFLTLTTPADHVR